MKYISLIFRIIPGLLFIGFGLVSLYNYYEGTDKQIAEYQTLLTEGVTTQGLIDSVYKEISIRDDIKSYSIDYFFAVNEKEYKGKYYFDNPDELLPIVTVHYLPNNPEINGVDVESKLEEELKTKNSTVPLILGWVTIIFGIILVYFRGIRNFRKGRN